MSKKKTSYVDIIFFGILLTLKIGNAIYNRRRRVIDFGKPESSFDKFMDMVNYRTIILK